MPLDYQELYLEFRDYLLKQCMASTKELTQAIKSFFILKYNISHKVMCSHAESSEYLTDLLILNFRPKEVISRYTLEVLPPAINALMAVESELGGSSASSAYGVMKNVAEDFIKLLLIQCEHRVMIFTSLPYTGEINHIEKRAKILQTLYQRTPGLSSGVLLIHIEGRQVNSTQVQAIISENTFTGFLIAKDGRSITRIVNPNTQPNRNPIQSNSGA
ncbi:hypothetical protein D3C77_234160 [compost metagenome]